MMNNRKFCPRCGTANNISDRFCVRCRYDFRRGGRKSGSRTLLILIILLLIGWVVYRIYTGKPIIPAGLLNFAKNMSSNMSASK